MIDYDYIIRVILYITSFQPGIPRPLHIIFNCVVYGFQPPESLFVRKRVSHLFHFRGARRQTISLSIIYSSVEWSLVVAAWIVPRESSPVARGARRIGEVQAHPLLGQWHRAFRTVKQPGRYLHSLLLTLFNSTDAKPLISASFYLFRRLHLCSMFYIYYYF